MNDLRKNSKSIRKQICFKLTFSRSVSHNNGRLRIQPNTWHQAFWKCASDHNTHRTSISSLITCHKANRIFKSSLENIYNYVLNCLIDFFPFALLNKVGLSPSKKIPRALFVLPLFKFLFFLFDYAKKPGLIRKINFKIYGVTT